MFTRVFVLGSLLIPRSLVRPLGSAFALALEKILHATARAIRENLSRILALPPGASPARVRRELGRRARRALLNYGTYLFDHAYFSLGPRERLRELTALRATTPGSGREERIDGLSRLERALASGRGAVLVTGHLGFWDLGGAALAELGHAVSVVAKAGGDARQNRYRDWPRRRRGIDILWVGGPADSAFSLISALAALRAGRIVALLGDRPSAGALIQVPFFGRDVAFPAGAAALARSGSAPLLPAFVVLDERSLRYRPVIEEPIDVPHTSDRAADIARGTAAFVAVLERYVRSYPEQWYNFYPVFTKAPPSPTPR